MQDPLLGAAIIGGLGSLIGGLFGSSGQSSTNRTNLQIARETNAANRANQEYQNAWNLEQWNRENAYNSPIMQRTRLEEAGLNPIFYGLDGNGAGTGLQSAPFIAQTGAPMQNSMLPLANGIADAGLKYAQIQNIEANTKKVEKDTEVTELERKFKEATLDTTIQVGNMQVKVTQNILDMNDAQRKVYIKSLEETDAKISDYQSQIATRSKQMEIAEFTAQTDRQYKEASIKIQQAHVDNETKKIANDLTVALKQLDIAMFNAQTSRGDLDLKNSQWSKYLEKEYGLDIAIKNGQLSITAADYDKKIKEISKTRLEAIKLVKDITYGEGTMGQAAFMLDNVVTTYGLANGLYHNQDYYINDFNNNVNATANQNVNAFKNN